MLQFEGRIEDRMAIGEIIILTQVTSYSNIEISKSIHLLWNQT